MKKLAMFLTLAVTTSSVSFVSAKNFTRPDKAAGPNPLITVATDCVRADDGVEVTKYYAEGAPSMKNQFLAHAMHTADFQVSCDGPKNLKESCAVSRTTPSGVEHIVYEAISECD